MTPPTVAAILAAARREGLHLDESTATVSEAGLDFLAVFARDPSGVTWVARAPRRDDVLARARHEEKVLKLVASHLPVAVPDWRIVADDLIAYPKLPGVPVGEIDMQAKSYVWSIDAEAPPPELVATTGSALAALHAIPKAAIREAGFETPDVAAVRAKLAGQLDTVKREIGVGAAQWERWQRWLGTDDYWPRDATFTHGDLHPGHLLVEQNRLVGILDWTEGEVADPAIDLSVFAMTMGERVAAAVLEAYAAAGGTVWPRLVDHIAEHIAFYPVKIGLFAIISGIEEYRTMARQGLGVT